MFQLLLVIIYLAFISLGLPDSLLGAAWPTVYRELDVPLSYMGIISMIIAVGTIFSSLQRDRLTKKLGNGKIKAFSVLMTAVALFGFFISHSMMSLCLWAIPYGLGAGSVDASLNNYVALHYKSRHMSWLHCMWGIGAAAGPYIMGYALACGSWNRGYLYISIIQIILTTIIFVSLPLWKGNIKVSDTDSSDNAGSNEKPMKLIDVLRLAGVKEVMVTFFCYCAIEQTTGLWGSSFLVLTKGIDATTAASFASLFFIGITVGRGICGFITFMLSDTSLIRLGQFLVLIGGIFVLLPFGKYISLIGLIIVGLGCAPIYPCIIHSTPNVFGANNSQAVIGVQMAAANAGTCFMPPIFGLIANYISIKLFPIYIIALLLLMITMYSLLLSKTKRVAE